MITARMVARGTAALAAAAALSLTLGAGAGACGGPGPVFIPGGGPGTPEPACTACSPQCTMGCPPQQQPEQGGPAGAPCVGTDKNSYTSDPNGWECVFGHWQHP